MFTMRDDKPPSTVLSVTSSLTAFSINSARLWWPIRKLNATNKIDKRQHSIVVAFALLLEIELIAKQFRNYKTLPMALKGN